MRSSRALLPLVGLTLLNLLVFGQILGHSFIAYDDGQFVYENAQVKQGLTGESIAWALTSTELGFYPVTWLSHMLDVELYGLNPRGHFASALLFHILASWTVFFALQRLTGSVARSAIVAALFAIHPMHVESVAWLSERRDTLSTIFGMLAIAVYAALPVTRGPLPGQPPSGANARAMGNGSQTTRMLLVTVLLALSLMAKQMFVTLPFLLLVLDYWPQKRLSGRAVIEKLPLFVVAAGGIAVALVGQMKMEAVQATTDVPLALRLQNAVVAYAKYLGKLFVPVDMNPLYPFLAVSGEAVALSALLLFAITAGAFVMRRKAPYLLVGWLWFLGTLVPVIGIVKIGAQAMADRYTYVPYIGLFIALTWGAAELVKVPRKTLAAATAVVLAACAFLAWRQARLWKDTHTLFTHTLAVTGPNPAAEYTLAQTLQLTEPDRALEHFGRVISLSESMLIGPIRPPREPYVQSYVGSGTALLMKARGALAKDPAAAATFIERAETAYRRAIQLDARTTANARRNLTLAAQMKGAARPQQPKTSADPFIDDGVRRLNTGDVEGAIGAFRKAVDLEPQKPAWRVYLALALMRAKRNDDAIAELREAKRLDPGKANEYVTRALRVPPAPDNLDRLIARLR